MLGKTIMAMAALEGLVQANSTPIFGTYPGYTVGKGATGITIEVFFDYLCSACQSENPVINKLLEHEWLDGTVKDQVYINYTPFPLPYHTHSYEVARFVPYFMDLCIADSTKCFSNQYRDFTFDQLETVLSMKTTSKDEFIVYWSASVATELGLAAADLEAALNDRQTDLDVRSMWKYAAAKGVNGTPTSFVNGAHLDDVPFTVHGWMKLLNEIYDSQYKAPSQHDVEHFVLN